MATDRKQPAKSKLDEPLLRNLFEEAVKRSGAFGAQLSIIKAGEQVEFATGVAHAQRNLSMTSDTLMKIGSVSKVFNAMIIVKLSEEGCLELEAPVLEYLPEFAVSDPEAVRTITLRQLLSMSSGLDNGPYDYYGGGDDALARYVGALHSLPQHFLPGRYFGYSNAGSCIAGLVASRVTGKPWEQLLRDYILQPAGLTRSATSEADVLYQPFSAGHELSDDGSVEITDPTLTQSRCMAPSGGALALCAGDLARFGMMFVARGHADNGNRLLTESSVERMRSPQIAMPIGPPESSYCIGCATEVWNGVRVVGHAGATRTSSAFLYWFPERQGSIALIANTNRAMGKLSELIFQDGLASAFGFEKPSIKNPMHVGSALNLDRYIGVYQQMGATMIVTKGARDTLKTKYIPEARMYGLRQQACLSSLGGDRFISDGPYGADIRRMATETAFFGSDSDGRATNMLNLGFPMRRID